MIEAHVVSTDILGEIEEGCIVRTLADCDVRLQIAGPLERCGNNIVVPVREVAPI